MPKAETVSRLAQELDLEVRSLLLGTGGPVDLRTLRTERGLSARETAARAHMTLATYAAWEGGRLKKAPKERSIQPLAEVLSATPEEVRQGIEVACQRRRERRPSR